MLSWPEDNPVGIVVIKLIDVGSPIPLWVAPFPKQKIMNHVNGEI